MNVIDSLSYEVIDPQDERYEAARAIWNGSIDHRPAAIARPRTDAEVAEALLRARDQGTDIAVRGGGHSMQGHSMSDGGVTIDLSAMNRVEVDAQARRAAWAAARCSATSHGPPARTAWRSPTATCRTPASPASRSAAGSAGSRAATASRSTACVPRAS